MDAHDQLLLSEGVCRQLGIIQYHCDVETWRGGRKKSALPAPESKPQEEPQPPATDRTLSIMAPHAAEQGAKVPTVRVNLVQSVQLLPHQSLVVEVSFTGDEERNDVEAYLLEPTKLKSGLQLEPSLLSVSPEDGVLAVVNNPTGCSMSMEEGTLLGEATPVSLVESAPDTHDPVSDVPEDSSALRWIQTQPTAWRQQKLVDSLGSLETLTAVQQQKLLDFLKEHHAAFALEEGERGETDLVELHIDTGEAEPRRCPPRRMPFTVREEVAKQLDKMQAAGVIEPSISPWSSPVVMVRKKDGTHRFCVDYRQLNAVTKADTYPLPRIDDLLDQLGRCQFFSTLDLASGYWQIRVNPTSQEKTAFMTPQGLYEFKVMPFGLTNAPAVFQRLMQRLLAGLNPASGPDFVAVYIDDALVFSQTLEEHLDHLKAVIQRVSEAGLKLKPSKCCFVRQEVEYLGHVVTPQGLKPNDALVAAIAQFPQPTDVNSVRRFIGLASYYRRFIKNFSRISEPLRELTRKNATFQWTPACGAAMTLLKEKLTTAPVLAFPAFDRDFTVETDASISGIGAVLSQRQDDGKLHPVAYASRSLSSAERNYSVTELETLAVVWALTKFHHYLYGRSVTVMTDHAAVRAILETPNPSCKHARWWTKVYGSGLKDVKIAYRAGKFNSVADALSRSPQEEAPVEGVAEQELQVSVIQSSQLRGDNGTSPSPAEVSDLLEVSPAHTQCDDFALEQRRDPKLKEVIDFLERGELPEEEKTARQIALQKSQFTLQDNILYYLDHKQGHHKRVAVPRHVREQLLTEHHSSLSGGHFGVKKTYGALARHWWWDGMYSDVVKFVTNCPECAIVTGGGRHHRAPLHPIPVSRPFQIVGVDIMELPQTNKGNKYVLVFQDFLTKWPLAFPMPDQKTQRIAELLVNEVIPLFGVPEALLSDRGTNLLSHLMQDVCRLLGIQKLNTTAHHPECDGMVERFNRTLKTMLRKQAAKLGSQWDEYIAGALWAYRNVPHDATGEKPSFLLLGVDCRTPTEAALLPPHDLEAADISDYREKVVLSLSSARQMAADSIRTAQARYKKTYDRSSRVANYKLGDWVLVKFPQEETGRMRKLSRPWHGPYRIVDRRDPDVTVVKVYSPQDGQIQVHQNRVAPCPPELPSGFFWYGTRRARPGRPPKWVNQLLQGDLFTDPEDEPPEDSSATEPMEDSPDAEGPQGLLSLEDSSPDEDEGPTAAHSVDPLEDAWSAGDTGTARSAVNSDLPTDASDAEEQPEPAMSGAYGNVPSPRLPDPDLTRAPEIKRGRYELRTKTAPPS